MGRLGARPSRVLRALVPPSNVPQRKAPRDHAYVGAVRPHPARGPRRRRGAEPPLAGPGRLRSPGGTGHLLLAAAGLQGAAQGRGHRPRGDGRDRRPGGSLPRAAAEGAVRGHRPLDRVRSEHLPAEGPQGRGLPARANARGDVHPAGEGPVLLLQGPAGQPLPDPDEVPGRGAPPGRNSARPRVRDEGLLLLRCRPGRTAEVLRPPSRRLHQDLRAARFRVRHRAGDVGGDGRLGQRGVPGCRRVRRGHLRPLSGRLCGQCGGGSHRGSRADPVRRRAARARGGHSEHADHRHAGGAGERALPAGGPSLAGERHPEERGLHGGRAGRLAPSAGGRRAGRSGGGPETAGGAAGAGRGRGVHRGRLRRQPGTGQGLHRTGADRGWRGPRRARGEHRAVSGRSHGLSPVPAG